MTTTQPFTEDMKQAQYNLYDSLMIIYDIHSITDDDRHNQIPTILAVIAITNDDVGKVEEILKKFGGTPFTTVVGPWGNWVLEQIGIELPPDSERDSPTNIQDIETKINA